MIKKDKIFQLCKHLIDNSTPLIREVASVLGNVVAAMETVPYGKMYYRNLDKIEALKTHKGNFDKQMTMFMEAKEELI